MVASQNNPQEKICGFTLFVSFEKRLSELGYKRFYDDVFKISNKLIKLTGFVSEFEIINTISIGSIGFDNMIIVTGLNTHEKEFVYKELRKEIEKIGFKFKYYIAGTNL